MDVLTELNELINAVLYEDDFYCDGTELTDEQRLYYVESLELMKKTTYLMQGQSYTIPTHILDRRDIGYRMKQLIYVVEHPKHIISIDGVPLADQHFAFVAGLKSAYQKAAQLNA